MSRLYLPLLPLPVLAVLAAVSACSKPRTEEAASHVIPPAAPFVASAAAAEPKPALAPAAEPADEKPTPEEVKAFERPVKK